MLQNRADRLRGPATDAYRRNRLHYHVSASADWVCHAADLLFPDHTASRLRLLSAPHLTFECRLPMRKHLRRRQWVQLSHAAVDHLFYPVLLKDAKPLDTRFEQLLGLV